MLTDAIFGGGGFVPLVEFILLQAAKGRTKARITRCFADE
jgi:hypothetical protein